MVSKGFLFTPGGLRSLIIVVLFLFVKLLVIYLFASNLPIVYYSFTSLTLPSYFSFSIFRKAFLDIFR